MKNERLFLITKKIDGQMVVLGYIKSPVFPSTIANDQEKAKAKFGYSYVTVTEITERCHIKF